jgi:predicted SAM-dependent methyltransferase
MQKYFFWIFNGHFFRKRKIYEYLHSNKKRKLHLGFTKKIDGFLNSQILGEIPIDVTKKFPFKNETFDTIYSSHLIEHIHRKQIEFYLIESYRILSKGGVNIISTPSVNKIFEICFKNSDKKKIFTEFSSKFYDDDGVSNSHIINLSMRAFGHRFLIEEEYIKFLSKKIGYNKCYEVSIDDIPDKKIIDYIKNHKPKRWIYETSNFVIQK